MKTLLMTIAAMLFVGCSSTELSTQEMALVQAHMQTNTLSIDCPAGCKIDYRDPRDQVSIPKRTNGWDALIAVGQSAERLVGGAVPIAGMGYLGGEAIKALAGSGAVTSTTNNTTTSTDNTRTTVDHSIGDYSGQASGNTGQIMPGNSGRIDSDDDYTSKPTVVNQPEPVVVQPVAQE